MKFRFLYFFLLITTVQFSAQKTEIPPSAQIIIDTLSNDKQDMIPADSLLAGGYFTDNKVYNKKLDSKLYNKYSGKEYNYEIIKPKESLWQRIKRNISKFLNKIFGDMDPTAANQYTLNFLRILGLLVLGVLLYFLTKYLISKEGNFFFSKKNSKLNLKSGDIAENIHEINFENQILKSENEEDFRSAIRYRFLQILKVLSDKKRIQWTPEKTNQDYAGELKEQSDVKQFEDLAYIFDYAWYGDFPVTENDYQFYKNKFINIKF